MEQVQDRDINIETLADEEFTEAQYSKNEEQENLLQILGKSPKLVGKIQSQIDKIDAITINADGSVIHKILRHTKKDQPKLKKGEKPRKGAVLSKTGLELGKHRTWPSVQSFNTWRTKHLNQRKNAIKEKLSPLEYFVT